MIIVEEWINSPRQERIAHTDINEPCIERGGNSTVHRGVLAEYLNTNFPTNVDLCHLCGNGKCSNPKHLYWGTRKENIQDAKDHGTWLTPWEAQVKKYGYEEAKRRNRERMLGNKNAEGNKGRILTEDHKRKISEGLTNYYK